jgi:hypothetical protein
MKNRKFFAALGAFAVLAAVAIPTAPADATVSSVFVSKSGCSPDATVWIVYNLTPKATSEIHYGQAGGNFLGSTSKGFTYEKTVAYNTHLRGANAWIYSGYSTSGVVASISGAVAECVG